jgi:hypothetical protein
MSLTKRLATRRATGPVAEAEGDVAVGRFERGRVPIAQRGNPREDVENLLSAARFNKSSCTVTRAVLDLMLEKTPLRLSRGACLDQMVRPRCQHRTAAAAAMAWAGTDVDLRSQCAADLYGFIPILGAV